MGLTSIWHWIVLLIIVLAVFGTKKFRNIGRDLGGAVHDFKQGLNQGSQADTHASHSHKDENIIEHQSDNDNPKNSHDKQA